MIAELIEQAKALLIFKKDSVIFTVKEQDHTLIKEIDFPNLIAAIQQTDFQSNWYIHPQVRLHHISQREGRTTTISSIPHSTYLLKFESFSLRVPLPGAVIVHCQSQLWVYAYKNELSLSSTLYHYPLPNIDSSGKVCWGNVALPSYSPGLMWNTFVTSEFNQDYDNNKSQAYPYNVVTQLKEVAQSSNTVYPERDLVSTNIMSG